MAEHFGDNGVRAAAITYGLQMTAAAICFAFIGSTASVRRQITETADYGVVSGISRSVIAGVSSQCRRDAQNQQPESAESLRLPVIRATRMERLRSRAGETNGSQSQSNFGNGSNQPKPLPWLAPAASSPCRTPRGLRGRVNGTHPLSSRG